MDRLIEIVRRFAIVGIWIFGSGITVICFIGAQDHGVFAGVGLGVLFLTWLVTKVVNWIFVR